MVYLHLTFTEDISASLLQCLFLALAFAADMSNMSKDRLRDPAL